MDATQSTRNPLVLLVLLMMCLSIIGSILAAGATYTSASQPAETAIASVSYPSQNALQPPLNDAGDEGGDDQPEEEEANEEEQEEEPQE